MSKRKLIQGTKFRWERGWTFYRVQAVLDESLSPDPWPEISTLTKKEYEADQQQNWTGHIITLNSPILSKTDITTVIATNKFRVYPPFWINKKASIASSFDEVTIPSGALLTANQFQPLVSPVEGIVREYNPL